MLNSGMKVLFSGTPCQVAGLKLFLKRDYDNLYTIDLICHGVPNYKLFIEGVNSVIDSGEVPKSVSFRDKKSGWGKIGYIQSDKKRYVFDELHSSYYFYFQNSSLLRDSCYSCDFASCSRVGDITIGDYWKIETAHPEIKNKSDYRGDVSCMLINTKKGAELLEQIKEDFVIVESSLELVKERNGRLNGCGKDIPKYRRNLLLLYSERGYAAIDDYWKRKEKIHRLKIRLKEVIRPIYQRINRLR